VELKIINKIKGNFVEPLFSVAQGSLKFEAAADGEVKCQGPQLCFHTHRSFSCDPVNDTATRLGNMTGRHHKHHVFLLIVALCISIVTSLSTTTAGTTIGTCIQDFQEIYDSEAFVLDTSVSRTYVICPNKLYEIGELDVNRGIRKKDDGSPPLPLRSNVHLLCGENGSRDNLCYITGGYLQVDGTAIGGISDDLMENVLVEGFVFVDAIMYSFWGMKSGHVTFRDCEWRVSL
jgi:hypothetical protein